VGQVELNSEDLTPDTPDFFLSIYAGGDVKISKPDGTPAALLSRTEFCYDCCFFAAA
jgi:hypothetical protein